MLQRDARGARRQSIGDGRRPNYKMDGRGAAPWASGRWFLSGDSASKRSRDRHPKGPHGRILVARSGGISMLIADVLRVKGRNVVKVNASDSVRTAVHLLAANRIGAVVVEDQRLRLVGVFSERDFINAVASHGAVA